MDAAPDRARTSPTRLRSNAGDRSRAGEPPTVAVTAGRKRDEQAVMLERRGLQVVMFPLLETGTAGTDESIGEGAGGAGLRAVTEDLAAHPPTHLVANTGYGMRTWFSLARDWGLLEGLVEGLRRSTVVARGAKALGELRKVGLDARYKAPGETMAEVAAHLSRQDLARARVAVQLHGNLAAPPEELAVTGAELVLVPVYATTAGAHQVSRDLATAITAGRVDAVTFTAAPQIRVLASRSREEGTWTAVLAAFDEGGVVAACIGEVCAGAAVAAGISSPLVPAHPRLPSLVGAVATRLLGSGGD